METTNRLRFSHDERDFAGAKLDLANAAEPNALSSVGFVSLPAKSTVISAPEGISWRFFAE